MSTLAMFMPLAKVDADQRLVQGVATTEKPDRSGEICDYESTKPYFEAWSAQCRDASGGKSLGAVRAMHGAVAAGKLTGISFDDLAKSILVTAKIVDDDEWQKVLEGVYTGFSQGGRYIARWDDEASGLTRYTAEPFEISLVDVPCLPDAIFEIVRNGVSEFRKFAVIAPISEAAIPEADAEAAPSVAEPSPATESKMTAAEPAPHIVALGKAAAALSQAADKLEHAIAENRRLNKTIVNLENAFTGLEKRITRVEAQPAPARAALRAPAKEHDGRSEGGADSVEAAIKRLASLPNDQRALALTKVSLANPLSHPF